MKKLVLLLAVAAFIGFAFTNPTEVKSYKIDKETKKRMRINMHREVIHAPKGVMTDHINLNTLDNRRSNLRLATHSDNAHNTRLPRNNTTGYRGVSKHSNNYVAHINKDNKYHYLGYFSDPKEAALAYNKAAIELHGEFASLNAI